MSNPHHEQNRRSWNLATAAHNRHKGDQAAFFRAGGSTLFPEEVELLGELEGRDLVHLQCNAGQDTLSLARLGARVTGVDISDAAVEFARTLSHEAGIPADFHRADVLDWIKEPEWAGRFDIAFASYGVLPWIGNLAAWAHGVARILGPGGRLVLLEFHPAAMIFDEQLRLRYPYGGGRHVEEPAGVGDYVAQSGEALTPGGRAGDVGDFHNPHPSHEFTWGVGDIVGELLAAGLALDVLREYSYSNGWAPFVGMRRAPGRRWYLPEGMPELPLMLGVAARKPFGAAAED
jgi:SAM-dependent methyltransferase